MPLSSGARLGPYEIVSAIGAGGMGEVYRARDTRLDRTVAIKVLPAEMSASPDRRARFEREAKTIAALSHPHICAIYDVGEAFVPNPGSRTPNRESVHYLVMEHLVGETLADLLQKGPVPLEQALDVGAQIADALSAAHRQGVIHRDLKPGNVMLTRAGAKLLDFGLAKLKGHGVEPAAGRLASLPTRSAPLTAEGTIVGTLQYMAPEQLEGKEADARADLWALGTILYEMLTGQQAFGGASAASIITAIMSLEPPPVSSRVPLAPPPLDRLVRSCLAKDPDDRWESAHDLAHELRVLSSDGRPGEGVARRSSREPDRVASGGSAPGSPSASPQGELLAVIARSRLTMKNDISYLVFKSSDEVVRAISEIARHFPRDSDDVFHINQGGGEIAIVCDADHEPLVAGVRAQAVEDLRPVGVLRVRETQDDAVPLGADVPGLYAYFLGRLAANGVNVLDVISTRSQLTLVLAESDLTAAFVLLNEGIRACRGRSGL